MALDHALNHLADVWLANDFQTANDESKLEIRLVLLNMLDLILDDLELFFKGNCLAVVVEQHSKNMSELYCHHVLISAFFQYLMNDLLKELFILSKV